MAGPSPCLVYSVTMAKVLIKQGVTPLACLETSVRSFGPAFARGHFLAPFPGKEGVWEYPPAVSCNSTDWSWLYDEVNRNTQTGPSGLPDRRFCVRLERGFF